MQTIVSVQALRAIAAIAVALTHLSQVGLMVQGRANDPIPLYHLAMGVDLFFVISGFIMVYSSEQLFAAPGGTATFSVRRLARILLPYWIVTLVAIPAMTLPWDWSTLVASALFIPYYNAGGNIAPLYGVGWTLNFEMFFYALFAVAVCWPRKIAVPALCLTLCGLVIVGRLLRPHSAPLVAWTDPIMLEFAFGMILALAYRHRVELPNWVRLGLLATAAAAVWFVTPGMPPTGYRVLMWGIPAAMILAGAVLGKQETDTGPIAGLAKLLGDASYMIYLIHPIAGAVIITQWWFLQRFPVNAVLVTGLIATCALSVVIYLYLERPTTQLLQRSLMRAFKALRDQGRLTPIGPSATLAPAKPATGVKSVSGG